MKIPIGRAARVIYAVIFGGLPLSSLCSAESGFSTHARRAIVDQLAQYESKKSCMPHDFGIAIDVGHTIEAPGALSARGMTEYSFNLKLANRIVQKLREAGYENTHLIVARGIGRAQLMQRSRRANLIKADLFLSLHHDDVQPTYYEKWAYNGRVHHFSDRFSGYSLFISHQNQYPIESLHFAKLLGAELSSRGMKFSAHHSENIVGERRQILDPARGVYRFDELVVLKTTKAPAVLLEAGIIVNREEELVLASSERQEEIGAAVLAAVTRFCGEQQQGLLMEALPLNSSYEQIDQR
jgi:N-acetylmuramoyl-L-alanine amidase